MTKKYFIFDYTGDFNQNVVMEDHIVKGENPKDALVSYFFDKDVKMVEVDDILRESNNIFVVPLDEIAAFLVEKK